MSESEAFLEVIKAKRETRDRDMLQMLPPILGQLKGIVHNWIDGEFKDLNDEISHIDSFSIRDSASERISRYMTNLTRIRQNQLPIATNELDELIELIKEQKFESAEEAIRILQDKISPIIEIIFSLSRARESLDGMADMISIPPPPPIRRSNEET